MTAQRFPIRIGRRSRLFLHVAFGATSANAWAELSDDGFVARFGRFELGAPLANVARWRIEGPFRWITAIGIRRSVRHADISFAGSPHGGVRLDFRTPVRWGRLTVPAFYVGADDLDGFAAALAARGIPGEDGRRR
jgi:hypothetical protein